MDRIKQAERLVTNPLLIELIEAYQWQLFQQFIGDGDSDVWAKARAARDLGTFIDNKAREIASGLDNTTD